MPGITTGGDDRHPGQRSDGSRPCAAVAEGYRRVPVRVTDVLAGVAGCGSPRVNDAGAEGRPITVESEISFPVIAR
jgi:hypothetical protein